MTLQPTEPPRALPHSVRAESGDACGARSSVAALDPFVYRYMRWCVNCGGEQLLVSHASVPGGAPGEATRAF